jgi:hypothetical protein
MIQCAGSSASLEELAQHCELRGTVGEFLASQGERTLECLLAEARPKHVKNQVSAADLPVGREAKARKDMAASLGWLTATEALAESHRRAGRPRGDARPSRRATQPRSRVIIRLAGLVVVVTEVRCGIGGTSGRASKTASTPVVRPRRSR